ncbi:MAG: FAD-binding oxidoreductase [Candidatus Wallbacteria bacterium]|nr:FAD-binding oxidoreductase [Candidatus Wallbacteria bacterium]
MSASELAPADLAQAARMAQEASVAGRALAPRGGNTRGWMGRPSRPDAVEISTRRLSGVVHYEPDDLTVTVQAGIGFHDLQRQLGAHGQWLPVNPPAAAGATIGGLLAANACGSLRGRFGAWRDLVLGMSVALSDGQVVKSGGRVVKNVTGYDVHKLHVGALGTLGLIGQASLKILPLPQERRIVLASFASTADAVHVACDIAGSRLEPAAVEILRGRTDDPFGLRLPSMRAGAPGEWALAAAVEAGACLAVRFAGAEPCCARGVRDVRALVAASGGAHFAELLAADCDAAWAALDDLPVGAGAVLRIAATPGTAARLVSEEVAGTGGRMVADVVSGVVHLLWDDAVGPEDMAGRVERLRSGLGQGASCVLLKAPPQVRERVDVWGPRPVSYPLMLAVKRALDPGNVWNPGRFVGEI